MSFNTARGHRKRIRLQLVVVTVLMLMMMTLMTVMEQKQRVLARMREEERCNLYLTTILIFFVCLNTSFQTRITATPTFRHVVSQPSTPRECFIVTLTVNIKVFIFWNYNDFFFCMQRKHLPSHYKTTCV